ncbi:MAG: hypothetical protein AB1432_01395 [Bacteroidota bacterium]
MDFGNSPRAQLTESFMKIFSDSFPEECIVDLTTEQYNKVYKKVYDLIGYLNLKHFLAAEEEESGDQANRAETLVSHVCGGQGLKKKILNKFIDRITYYEKQKLTLPRSEKLKSRIRELKYMMKEIDNIFFENDSRKSG